MHTATTVTHHTNARPWVITGRDISTTASSLAWAPGAAGAIATAGAGIASAVKAEAATAADLVTFPIAATAEAALHAAEAATAPHRRNLMLAERVPTLGTQHLLSIVTAVVVDRTTAVAAVDRATVAVVVDTKADTGRSRTRVTS